jgi:hypothetical protein
MMNAFQVVTDSTYTGGLSWLYRFDAEIEPTGDLVPNANDETVMDEIYTVRFPEDVDGAALLDDCDCVVSYEAK